MRTIPANVICYFYASADNLLSHTTCGPFISLYVYLTDAIFVFLIIATGAGVFTAKLGMPALVGEIFTGFLLGPPLADFVPFPEALVLVGEIGLIMLVLETGVELDVAQLRETGVRYVFTILRFECPVQISHTSFPHGNYMHEEHLPSA